MEMNYINFIINAIICSNTNCCEIRLCVETQLVTNTHNIYKRLYNFTYYFAYYYDNPCITTNGYVC